MAEAYLGEIRIFAGNFPPKGWAFCNGQLLSIQQNTALFSILGTRFGGDGKMSFALPNLSGAAPMGQGSGPGLTSREVGEEAGSMTVTLTSNQMPAHNHPPAAISSPGGQNDPTNNFWAETPSTGRPARQTPLYTSTQNVQMSPLALSVTGGSQPHNNMQPFLAMNYIICVRYGEFPPRG